jgi:hypothetical protein
MGIKSGRNQNDLRINHYPSQLVDKFFGPLISLRFSSSFSYIKAMSDENESSKTRIEEDLVIDVGRGSDLVAATELQAATLSNEEASRPTSVYSDIEKAGSIASDNKQKCAVDDAASISPSHTSIMKPAKAKKAWWRGRSSNMDADPKSFSSKKKISITAVIALAGSM